MDRNVTDSWTASEVELTDLQTMYVLDALNKVDSYLGTLSSGRTIVEASEVRDLLLDIRSILKGA